MADNSNDDRLVVHARPHPDLLVQRAGFPLDHRYVEQCWAPVVGPSSILLLRRLPWLWRAGTTLELDVGDLGRSLGLGAGASRHSAITRTIERVVAFRFARWSDARELEVFTETQPLSARQLERVPTWTQVLHHQLLDAHLAQLAEHAKRPLSSNAAVAPATAERLVRSDTKTTAPAIGLA